MFRSSSTRAIVFATDAFPKVRCGVIAADLDDLIPKYGGSAANTKGRRKLFLAAAPRYSCGDRAHLLLTNHEFVAAKVNNFLAAVRQCGATRRFRHAR
jgi:hypothetical protein